MSAHCCNHETPPPASINNPPRYRKILWIALTLNAAMFLIEIGAGMQAGSLSLLADAVDFAGDAMNYAVSLAVLASALAWRSRAALLKSLSMMGFGLYVLGAAVWSVWHGEVPHAMAMGGVALLALVVNLQVAWLLYAFREGDANMRSVWLCSRNDAIGNAAVFVAALGVFGTGTAWPDLAVASLMALLALHGGWAVLQQARGELAQKNGHENHGHPLSHSVDRPLEHATHALLMRDARAAACTEQAWMYLEAAHVQGQLHLKLHLTTHAHMLALALRTHDWPEAVGQLLRLSLVPLGHLSGRFPRGNPGRATVSAFEPVPVRPELMAKIADARNRCFQLSPAPISHASKVENG